MSDKNQTLLDDALARGIITDAQRAELETMRRADRLDSEERITSVSSFNEVFVSVGVMLLLGALEGMLGLVLGASAFMSACITLVLTTAVAEHFHRGRRFRLPIICCVLSAGMAIGTALSEAAGGGHGFGFFSLGAIVDMTLPSLLATLAVFITGAARYRIAFMMLPISILFTVIMTIAAEKTGTQMPFKFLLGMCGLMLLAVAIRFDLKDPARIHRTSDFAFWTYVVGSPLFAHSLFLSVIIDGDIIIGVGTWGMITLLAVMVSFIGLLMNRRALILSTVIYVGYVLFSALINTPMGVAAVLMLTVMLIGLYIIALGARWAQVRRWVMMRLPAWPWLARLPAYE